MQISGLCEKTRKGHHSSFTKCVILNNLVFFLQEEDVEEDASDAENVIAEQGIKAQEEVVPEKTDDVLK